MSDRLKGKIALIMGAGSVGPGWGNGRAMAVRFAEEGAKVFGVDIDLARMKETVERVQDIGGEIEVATCDVTQSSQIANVVRQCEEKWGRIDILVNNVGGSAKGGPVELEEDVWDAQVDSNLKSVFLSCKHVLPIMEKQGSGAIINMSSICGLVGHKYTTEAYTITKGAVTLMTKTVGVRYAKDNIRCNSIHPSTVDTPLVQILFKDPKRKEERFGEVPLGRLATEIDVANAALYLASDEAAFLNGVSLPVDGGLTAC